MRIMRRFPREFPLVQEYVQAVVFPHELASGEENADFFVELKGGDSYSFLACTPDYAKCYMERENERSFISPGLLLVRDIAIDSLLSAVEECLATGELTRIGVLQIDERAANSVESTLARSV
jgi:hypothetical protein